MRDLLPALAMSLVATIAITASRLLPSGDGLVLVRLGPSGFSGALDAPDMADIALVDLPAPGFAVLRGDAAQIRSVFGAGLRWKGNAPCSPLL